MPTALNLIVILFPSNKLLGVKEWFRNITFENNQDKEFFNEDKASEFLIKAIIATAYQISGNDEKGSLVIVEAIMAFDQISTDEFANKLFLVFTSIGQWTNELWEFWIDHEIFIKESLKLLEETLLPQPVPRIHRYIARAYALNGYFDKAFHHVQALYKLVPWLIGKDSKWEWVIDLAKKAPNLDGWGEFVDYITEKSKDNEEALEAVQNLVKVLNQRF